jgi:hypothetical protein
MMEANSTELIRALEMERDGDWDGAHRIVQMIDSSEAARVHAYLHRVESDLDNAQYWYSRAGESMPDCPLKEEWLELFNRFN